MTPRARMLVAALTVASVGACGREAPSSADSTAEDGTVVLPTQGLHGRAPAAVGGVVSIILLAPTDGDAVPTHEGPVTIDQFGLTFSPTRLIARVGQTVVFTNSESAIAHNVRIRALADTLDLLDADANPGERLSLELSGEGGYDVLCDMHPGMTAFIFATGDPYAVFADPDGHYVLDGIPPGSYQLRLWTADTGFHEAQFIDVGTGATGIDLDTSG